MTVDLNTCVPGQEVRLRHGKIVEYIEPIKDGRDTPYEHVIDFCSYMNDGCYWEDRRTSHMDVIEILPLETTESTEDDKHPSVAWWESCPWITDRKPAREDGDIYGRVHVKASEGSQILTSNWDDVMDGETWIHIWHWRPPAFTDREQALQLLDNHQDGWKPTTEQWLVIRKGLEAS